MGALQSAIVFVCALTWRCTLATDVLAIDPSVSNIRQLTDAVYTQSNGDACVRLLHASCAVGCAAPAQSRVQGPLAAAGSATSPSELPQGAVAVVAPGEAGAFLQRCAEDEALRSRLGGVLLEHADAFSGWNPAPGTPLADYALYRDAQYPWNPAGTGAEGVNFPFPIFQLDNVTTPIARQRAEYNNKHRGSAAPINIGRMDLTMRAAGNSSACIAAQTCLPLGGYSVWASLPPLPQQAGEAANTTTPDPPQLPTLLVLAGVDTGGMFHQLMQAADSPLSGLVAMLAAAQLLGNASSPQLYQRRVVFAAVMGEPWGLMGSRRLAWELHNGTKAVEGLNLDSIEGILEVGAVGRAAAGAAADGGDSGVSLFMHADKRPSAGSPAELRAALVAAAGDTAEQIVRIAAASTSTPGLPPSSASSFLRVQPSIPAILLSEFDAQFTNPTYHTAHDTVEGVSVAAITATAAVLGRALHALALGPAAPAPLQVNYTALQSNVQALMACLMTDSPGLTCDLAAALLTPLRGGAVQHYVGIMRTVTADPQSPDPYVKSDVERFIWNFLGAATATAAATGTPAPLLCRSANATACPPGTACVGSRDGIKGPAGSGACVAATVRYVPAWSASLACDGCNGTATQGQFRWKVTGEAQPWDERHSWPIDPLWTESNWPDGTPRLVMFLEESPGVEHAVLAAGLVTTAAAAAVAVALHVAWNKRMKRD